MALASGSIFAVQASATTGNTNGAGFNPLNANFPTDLATSNGTATSPSVTSATYTFVAGDVGAWLYVKSGTSWTPGWYNITSVVGGAATVNAAIGAAIASINAQGLVTYNAAAGVGTTASLSAGTYGVDYSQQDTADSTITDAASVAGSTTLTSASNPWKPVSVGNFFHLTTTGTGAFGVVGWYEIVSYTNAGSVVTDRTTNTNAGSALAAGTGQTGGAGRLNGLEDTFQAMLPAGALVFVKNGSYTLSGAISTSSTNGVAANPVRWTGFNSLRGDTCNGTNRPTLTAGANAVQLSQFQIFSNFQFTSTALNGFNSRVGGQFFNCKALNSSTTANRIALAINAASGSTNFLAAINCEAISQNGYAFGGVPNSFFGMYGCYGHDSVIPFNIQNAVLTILLNCISESFTTAGIQAAGGTNFDGTQALNCTIIGRAGATKSGIGINSTNSTTGVSLHSNNIITGCATGIANTTAASNSNMSQYNNFYNNTTDVTLFLKGPTDLALNPTFTNETEVSGTVGQGLAGSKFQDTTQNFTTAGVVANQDFLHITSGGSLTAGCYMITAITTTTNPNDTLTLNNNPGTGAATGVYWITVGHNLQIGTNLKALGFPSFTNATNSLTTSYPDIGAVQRQEPAGGGGTGFFIQ